MLKKVTIVLIHILVMACLSSTSAQDSAYRASLPTDIGIFVWKADSSSLEIESSNGESVEVYSIADQRLIPESQVQSNSLEETIKNFPLDVPMAINAISGEASQIYYSPGQEFAAYAVGDKDNNFRLALTSLKDGNTEILETVLIPFPFDIFSFRSQWNNNGSGLYVEAVSPPAMFGYYIYNITSDMKDLQVINFYDETSKIFSITNSASKVYDINSQGDELLMNAYLHLGNTKESIYTYSLIVMNINDFTFSIVSEKDTIEDAAFINPDDSGVLYLSDQGLFEYNSKQKKTHLITSDINATWVRQAKISPDGRYVAATDSDGTLYIVPVKP